MGMGESRAWGRDFSSFKGVGSPWTAVLDCSERKQKGWGEPEGSGMLPKGREVGRLHAIKDSLQNLCFVPPLAMPLPLQFISSHL